MWECHESHRCITWLVRARRQAHLSPSPDSVETSTVCVCVGEGVVKCEQVNTDTDHRDCHHGIVVLLFHVYEDAEFVWGRNDSTSFSTCGRGITMSFESWYYFHSYHLPSNQTESYKGQNELISTTILYCPPFLFYDFFLCRNTSIVFFQPKKNVMTGVILLCGLQVGC
jgi:hypothetical protein